MLNNLINQGFIIDSDKISVLLHPTEFRETLLKLIANAKHRILFNCLYLENDESGALVVNALKQAVTQHPQLQVDIFLDMHRAMRSRFGQSKDQNNAQWYYQELYQFNQDFKAQHHLDRDPINIYGVPCNGRELFGVYHIKGYVIDDQLLYTGTSINNNYCGYDTYRQDRYQLFDDKVLTDSFYNFSMTSFCPKLPANSGLVSSMTPELTTNIVCFSEQPTPAINKARRLDFKNFRQNYLLSSKLQYQFDTSVPVAQQSHRANNLLPGQVLVTPIYGIGKNNYINLCVFDAIANAKSSITIYTPYFNFTKTLTKRLMARCKHGVKVRIVVSDKIANDFYTPPESERYTAANSLPYLYEMNLRKFLRDYQDLLDSSMLEVYAWADGSNSYHAKGIVIDNQVYIFTGSNLNLRSFNVDTENALVCYDPYHKLAPQMQQEFDYFLQHGNRLTNYEQVEHKKSYPQRVRRTLRRASFFFIDRLAKRLF